MLKCVRSYNILNTPVHLYTHASTHFQLTRISRKAFSACFAHINALVYPPYIYLYVYYTVVCFLFECKTRWNAMKQRGLDR